MSRAHHNAGWYRFSLERWPRCILCEQRPAVQMHHFQIVGSALYRGPAPRRSSSYNAAGVCDVCHDNCHDHVGERRMIEAFLGSHDELYRRMTRRMHEYIDHLEGMGP